MRADASHCPHCGKRGTLPADLGALLMVLVLVIGGLFVAGATLMNLLD
jgi:hypothetical protein